MDLLIVYRGRFNNGAGLGDLAVHSKAVNQGPTAAQDFRARAAEMMAEANKARFPAAKRSYLELAEEWNRLAEMAERGIKT